MSTASDGLDRPRYDPLEVDGRRPAVARVAALPADWVTDAERLVLLALACDSYDGRTTAPGMDHLASWCGLLPTSVKRIVQRLQKPTPARPALLAALQKSRGFRRTTWLLDLPDQPSLVGDGKPSPNSLWSGTVDSPRTVSQLAPTGDGEQSPNSLRSETPPFLPSHPPSSPTRSSAAESSPAAMGWPREEEVLDGRSDATELPPEDLAAWIAREDGISLEDAAAVVRRAQADPTTAHSAAGRLRAAADYRQQVHRQDQAARRAEHLANRKCAHGVVDGRKVLGRGAASSRVCSDCETADPASEHDEARSA
jgi:hypothetical protein